LCGTRGGKLKTFNMRMSPPSIVSERGVHDLLEKKMLEKELKRLKDTSSSYDVISPPSLPSPKRLTNGL